MKNKLQLFGLFILMTCVYSLAWAQIDPNFNPNCQEPTQVTVGNVDKYKADVQFKLSASSYETISHSGEYAATYSPTTTDYRVAHRYTTDDLALYNEYQLTKVSFVPIATTTATYTIMVYRVNSGANPSTTPTYQQAITYNSLTMGVWNDITLTTPVTINSTQELWIAIRCQTRSNTRLPFAGDSGPAVPQKGVKIYSGWSWGNSTGPYNWCIKGTIASPNSYKVEYDLAGYTQGTGRKITLNYMPDDTSMALESLSGLMSNTSYDAYIQRNCGAEVSSWVGPYTFTTLKDDDWCIDDFESYDLGDYLYQVSGANGCWRTSNGSSGPGTQDAIVSNEQVYQGAMAAKISYGSNMIFKLGDKTDGSFVVDFQLYLPNGRDADLGLLQSTSQIACSLRLNYSTYYVGRCSLRVANQATTFTIATDKWIPFRFEVNLHTDSCQLYVDGNMIRKWKYSTTYTGTVGSKTLHGLHFRGATNASRSLFYVDNINVPAPGSKDNPLTIDNAQDLLDLRVAVNQNGSYKNVLASQGAFTGFAGKYFVVTNDIDLSSVCGEDIGGQEVSFVPIGTTTNPFKGRINGQNHAISNLYINSPQDNVGLFGVIAGGGIDSLHLYGDYIDAKNNVGALCGTATNGVSFTAITTSIDVLGEENVGGIVGTLSQLSTIFHSTSISSIVATTGNAGGIAGSVDNSTINFVVNGSAVSGDKNVGGIVGSIAGNGSSINNALNTGMVISLSNNTDIGGIVGKVENTPTFIACYYDNQIFSKPSSIGIGKNTTEMLNTALQGALGTYWIYTEDLYPSLAITANKPISLLASNPLLLANNENIDKVNNPITLSLANDAVWMSADPNALFVDNDQAIFQCLNIDTLLRVMLTAYLESNIYKVYPILNNKLEYDIFDTLRLCQNQLPYLYQDSIVITAPLDTTLNYISSFGCDSIVNMTVIVNSSPQIAISGNATPCYGDSIVLSVTKEEPTDNILWSTGDTTLTLEINGVTSDMIVTVQVARDFDKLTCYDYDTIDIVHNPIYNHTDSIAICYSLLPYEYNNTGIFFTDSGWQSPIVFQTVEGCDSVIDVYLHLYFDTYEYDTIIICENQLPYTYKDTTFAVGTISGDYTLISPNPTGCLHYDYLHLVIIANPQVVISGDLIPCYGDNTSLLATSDEITDLLLWNTGDTTAFLNINNVISNLPISVQAARSFGGVTCYGYDSVEVMFNPIYNHDDTVKICYSFLPHEYGNSGIFFTDSGWQSPIVFQTVNGCDSVVNVYLYLYHDVYIKDTITVCENQLPLTYRDTLFLEGTTTGDYSLVRPNITGCLDYIDLHLTIVANPKVTISGDLSPCYGESTMLLARSDRSSDDFLWNTGDSTIWLNIPSVTTDMPITVRAERKYDTTSCYGYDSVLVIFDPIYNHDDTVNICYSLLPFEYGNSGVFFADSGWQSPIVFQSQKGCDSTVNVYVHLYYDTYIYDTVVLCENHLPYTYLDTLFLEGTVTGTYIISSINQTGCQDIVNLSLTVNPIPTVLSLTGDNRLFLGDTGTIAVQTNDIFMWSTGQTSYRIFVSPTTVGMTDYDIYLSNLYNCYDTVTFTVEVSSCGANYPAVDFENNSYQTQFYGRTCWMIENLRSTRFADGEPIVGALSYHSSVYPDSVYNVSIYGRLYNWYTAMRYGNEIQYNSPDLDNQGVCPEGWRLPTYNEYMELMTTFGYMLADLKSVNYWLDNLGNNSSNFTWLPAGCHNYATNQFINLYGNGYFITTTSISDSYFESFTCSYNCPEMIIETTHKNNAYSVRCVKTITFEPYGY